MKETVIDPRTPKKASGTLIKIFRNAALFTIGGTSYYALEVLCRGYSHWSMALCGGICLTAIYHMNRKLTKKNICLRAALGSVIITAVELICGCFVNLIFRLNVWDYSHLPLNLLGQICLPFTLLWMALCFPVCALCSCLKE